MKDREMLEAAARAAGYTLTWGEKYMVGGDEVDCTDLAYIVSDEREESPRYWSPLDDDGDALALAVALRLDIWHHTAHSAAGQPARGNIQSCGIDSEADRPAAVRRAIVKAAAQIGQQKDPQ